MEKNKAIGIAAGMLVIGLVAGSLIGGSMSNMNGGGKFGMERGNRAMGQMGMGSHVMPNGERMDNNGGGEAYMPGMKMGMDASMDMADMMKNMNAGLIGKTGDSFDQAFLSEMIVHHQGAVVMAELALTNANHQEIKNLAKAIIAAQNKEIANMQAWQKSWYQR